MNGETEGRGEFATKNLEELKAEKLMAALGEVTRIANEMQKIYDNMPNVREAKHKIFDFDADDVSIHNSMVEALRNLNESFLTWHY